MAARSYIGIGSIRYRVTFKGPGGHSFGSFGTVNPVHALGRAIARIADLQVPSSPRTTVQPSVAQTCWSEARPEGSRTMNRLSAVARAGQSPHKNRKPHTTLDLMIYRLFFLLKPNPSCASDSLAVS